MWSPASAGPSYLSTGFDERSERESQQRPGCGDGDASADGEKKRRIHHALLSTPRRAHFIGPYGYMTGANRRGSTMAP